MSGRAQDRPRAPRLALIGWGAIGQAVAAHLARGLSGARIVAVAVHDPARPREGLPKGSRVLAGPEGLTGCGADLVVEAAGRASVAPWGRAALSLGLDFAVSSTSAFADEMLLSELTGLAERNNSRLIIPPGALGGIDALAAARQMGLDAVEHRIIKAPAAWAGTAAEAVCDLATLPAPTTFFSGTAAEAAATYPQNANVAMITALAGLGPERTRIALIADPGATSNRHEITAQGGFGRFTITLENAPLPGNPKSSAMTALSLVRMIENRALALVI